MDTPLIIQLRGTSGSGKSTIVMGIMATLASELGGWDSVVIPPRKRTLYYKTSCGRIAIPGAYDTQCGGCDSLGSAVEAYATMQIILQREPGAAILAEGLLLSEDVRWTVQLPPGSVRCLFLTTSMERCLAQIAARRAEAGKSPEEFNHKKATDRAAQIDRARLRLITAGVYCRRVSPEQAPGVILKMLRLHAQLGASHVS